MHLHFPVRDAHGLGRCLGYLEARCFGFWGRRLVAQAKGPDWTRLGTPYNRGSSRWQCEAMRLAASPLLISRYGIRTYVAPPVPGPPLVCLPKLTLARRSAAKKEKLTYQVGT